MAKVKYTLLIPLNYNDRSEVLEEVNDAIFDDIFKLAGGYTIAGTAQGAYRMKSGQKQVDHSQIVWVVIDEENEQGLKALVAKIASLLDQEFIYLERFDSTVEFIPPAGGDT